jgi:hypothetical protein
MYEKCSESVRNTVRASDVLIISIVTLYRLFSSLVFPSSQSLYAQLLGLTHKNTVHTVDQHYSECWAVK